MSDIYKKSKKSAIAYGLTGLDMQTEWDHYMDGYLAGLNEKSGGSMNSLSLAIKLVRLSEAVRAAIAKNAIGSNVDVFKSLKEALDED